MAQGFLVNFQDQISSWMSRNTKSVSFILSVSLRISVIKSNYSFKILELELQIRVIKH